MIEKCEKPDVFNQFEYEMYYIRGFDGDGVYAWLAIDLRMAGLAIIHLEVVRFSHRVLKNLISDWQGIKDILRGSQVEQVVTTRVGTPSDHSTWIKFIKWFGFKDITQQVTSVQNL